VEVKEMCPDKNKYAFLFSPEDDLTWKEWVDLWSASDWDLFDLVASDRSLNFKKRALFLLMVPSDDLNPLYWIDKVGEFRYPDEMIKDFLSDLDEDLLNFAADLVAEFYPIKKSEIDGSIKEGKKVEYRHMHVIKFYNNCILKLLCQLSLERCEQIFSLYLIHDIYAIWGGQGDWFSPLNDLFGSAAFEKIKELADKQMREIIEDPNISDEKRHDTIWNYSSIVVDQGKKLTYSIGLYASQMERVVKYGIYNIKLDNVPDIFKWFAGDVYKDLRTKIALSVASQEDISIEDEDVEKKLLGAQMILKELCESDVLSAKVDLVIAQGVALVNQRERRIKHAQSRKDKLWNKMK